MRGEYYKVNKYIWCDTGSSPHAWRILRMRQQRNLRQRFIPTCVENMFWFLFGIFATSGSSPHAWRISLNSRQEKLVCRFIPTCVENISMRRSRFVSISVHPHMRGEYYRALPANGSMIGSSPHAWRIFYSMKSRKNPIRFIPTCVENMIDGALSGIQHRFIPTCVENIG